MYWRPTNQLENGRFLAVAIKVIGANYQEFAGAGQTELEAKAKAILRMWREARSLRGFDDVEDVFIWPSLPAGQPQSTWR